MIFVGNDWAEGHHDVYLMDEDGTRLGFAHLPEGIQGIARFHPDGRRARVGCS